MAKQHNSVRIIAGDWRGRRIPVPAGTSVRPTPDRVRETLFNWLRDLTPGARCLDLFAGTGILGLEALSREAQEVWFVDTDSSLVRSLQTQVDRFAANAKVIHEDASTVLDRSVSEQFDIVFLDNVVTFADTFDIDHLNFVSVVNGFLKSRRIVADAANVAIHIHLSRRCGMNLRD